MKIRTRSNGEIEIIQTINTSEFDFKSSSRGLTALSYNFNRKPQLDNDDIRYFKSQLAFRGLSPRGKIIEVLKRRLIAADMNKMDDKVALEGNKMAIIRKKTYGKGERKEDTGG